MDAGAAICAPHEGSTGGFCEVTGRLGMSCACGSEAEDGVVREVSGQCMWG